MLGAEATKCLLQHICGRWVVLAATATLGTATAVAASALKLAEDPDATLELAVASTQLWPTAMLVAHADARQLPPTKKTATLQPPQPGLGVAAYKDEVQQLAEWLKQRGAKLDKVEVRRSEESDAAGLGLYSRVRAYQGPGGRPWYAPWRRHDTPPHFKPLADFPLGSAITATNILKDPARAEMYAWMLEHGLVDERTIVLAYLVVEKRLGQSSELFPYISVLPKSFNTPLYWTEVEMQQLAGTTLHRATAAVSRQLRSQWASMQPALKAVARQAGAEAEPTFEDFLWAHSTFWSRGQTLPMPVQGAASTAVAREKATGAAVEYLEGLVPGLDLCNHRPGAGALCWWEVHASTKQGRGGAPAGSNTGSVHLNLHIGRHVMPGQELFISYGDKSNEELLLLHGFALPDNPDDNLMLHCSVPPPQQWDDTMRSRMELLQAYNLKPQFFLPAEALHDSGAAGRTPAGHRAVGGTPRLRLPAEVLSVLEVFMLSAVELAEALDEYKAAKGRGGDVGTSRQGDSASAAHTLVVAGRALAAPATPLPTSDEAAAAAARLPVLEVGVDHDPSEMARVLDGRLLMSSKELKCHIARLGLRMGALSTLVRMLEAQVVQLEGRETGTGSLEDDLRILQAGPAGVSHRFWSAVVYRAGQKQLAREYLKAAKRELSEVMRAITELHTAEAGAQR